MQVVVLKHPKAIAAKPERKLAIDLKTFEHLARRILSTSSNGDQARAIEHEGPVTRMPIAALHQFEI